MPSLSFLRSPAPSANSLLIQKRVGGLALDTVEVDPAGLIRITGWTEEGSPVPPQVRLDRESIALLQTYRLARPDLRRVSEADTITLGIAFEYLVPEALCGRAFQNLQITLGAALEHSVSGPFVFQPSVHYRSLIHAPEVLHREHIYGSGPPNAAVQPETLELARLLPGPVLDFGCGSGALVAQLRAAGTEAYGIELDNEVIRGATSPSVLPYLTFYDGQLPTKFSEGQFRSVFCSEVLEHIPNYQEAVREIARLCREQAIFTVPNASGIPLGFRHGLVPWHLMESTHVNFFNQQSLGAVLRPWFPQITFGRVGASSINDTSYHVSLVAYCRK